MAEDSLTVDAVNGAAYTAALAEMAAEADDPTDALNAAARELVAAATADAPRLTGRLAGAQRALPAAGRRVRVVADTPYAAAIHWGWPGHGIRRRPWLVATWERNPAPMDKAAESVQAGIDKAAAKT